jgi:protein SCO1
MKICCRSTFLNSSLVRATLVGAVAALGLFIVSCNRSPKQSTANAKHYHLTGTVVSIDGRGHMINVDAAAIPGFMDAMTMPYPVKPDSELEDVQVGDEITADLVKQGDDYWLQNIVVTGHKTIPQDKPTAMLHIPTPGELVPDFKFTNQSGRPISLDQYRGKALLMTFIYTRCPFTTFCPRLSHEFAEINHDLQSNPALYSDTRLLTVSFDPAHDTPKVLRAYGFSYAGTTKPSLFNHWAFAVPSAKNLPKLANYFGFWYKNQGGVLNHSLSTAVIGPNGKIFKWYHDNTWQPSDLIKDASDSLKAAS